MDHTMPVLYQNVDILVQGVTIVLNSHEADVELDSRFFVILIVNIATSSLGLLAFGNIPYSQ